MKSTDIAMIILIASISVGVAFAVVGAIPGLKDSSEPVKVKTIEKYSSTIDKPDAAIFNNEALNPTVDVTIGNDSQAEEQ